MGTKNPCRRFSWAAKLAGAVWLLAWAAPTAAQQTKEDNYARQARELAALRAALEGMEGELQRERGVQNGELQSLQAQENELNLLIQKERIRLTSMERIRARQITRQKSDRAHTQALMPAVRRALELVRERVRSSLPFRIEQRLQALEKIQNGLDNGTLDPRNAISRLWQFVEDEVKLTAESVLDRQVVETQGQRILAQVARLGMVALFYRRPNGRYGMAVPAEKGWRFEPLPPGPESRAVCDLFSALKKQIRTGSFSLPWYPLPEGGGP